MAIAKDFYYLLFYTFYRLDLVRSGREYNKWKALLGISVLQFFLLVIGDLWLQMATGVSRLLGLPKYAVVAVCAGICCVNYMSLLHRNQWEAYEKKFSQFSSRGRKARIALSLLLIALVLAMLFYSFHRFGVWKGRT